MNQTQIETRLQQHGHRLTRTRQRVIAALLASGGHVSADMLYEQMLTAGSDIGRMTVYRTLELLAAVGAIRPTYQGSGAAHYILLQNGHHHHLVCTRCNRTTEFEECAVAALSQQLHEQHDFQIDGHLLELYGLCAGCRSN